PNCATGPHRLSRASVILPEVGTPVKDQFSLARMGSLRCRRIGVLSLFGSLHAQPVELLPVRLNCLTALLRQSNPRAWALADNLFVLPDQSGLLQLCQVAREVPRG